MDRGRRFVLAGLGACAVLAGGALVLTSADEPPAVLVEGETFSTIRVGERVVLPFDIAAEETARAQVAVAPDGDETGALDGATLSLSFIRAGAPDTVCTSNSEAASKPQGVRQALATHRARVDETDPCRQPGTHAFVIDLAGDRVGEEVQLQIIASVIGRAPDLSGDIPVEERDRTGGGLGTMAVFFGGLLGAGLGIRRRRAASSVADDVTGLEDVGDLPAG